MLDVTELETFHGKRNEAFQNKNTAEYDTYKEKVKVELNTCKKRWVEKQITQGKTMWNITKLLSNKTKLINLNCLISDNNSLSDFINEVNKQLQLIIYRALISRILIFYQRMIGT